MESLLAELERMLFGWNYQVFLRAYRVPFVPHSTAEWYITQALGPSVIIGKVIPLIITDVISEVVRSLLYAGDTGSGPDKDVLESPRFKALVSAVKSELERTAAKAYLLAKFWLKEGHPAYPVFWDFAFVIAGPLEGLVLIGSSSD